MSEATLISEEYRKMQQQLHENPKYGVASVQFAPMVAQVIDATGVTELLDYGAGKGRLGIARHQAFRRRYCRSRPSIPAQRDGGYALSREAAESARNLGFVRFHQFMPINLGQ